MTKRKNLYMFFGLWAFLFLLSTFISTFYARCVKENLSSISLRYNTESISPSVIDKSFDYLKKMSISKVPQITLWNRLKNETIQNKVTDLTVNTNVIEVDGDISKVIPMTILYGSFFYSKDEKGCVIDEQTAYQLYGSMKVLNNVLLWRGKEYIVRGVVKAKDSMILLPLSNQEHLYQNVEVFYKEKVADNLSDNEASDFVSLLTNMGATKPDSIINGQEISWFLQLFSRVPIFLFACIVIGVYMKRTYEERRSIKSCFINSIIIIIIAIVMIKIIRIPLHIPSQYIPTKWSDFDFYVNKYHEIQNNILSKKNMEAMPRDLLLRGYQTKCILSVISNISLLGAFVMFCKKYRRIFDKCNDYKI